MKFNTKLYDERRRILGNGIMISHHEVARRIAAICPTINNETLWKWRKDKVKPNPEHLAALEQVLGIGPGCLLLAEKGERK